MLSRGGRPRDCCGRPCWPSGSSRTTKTYRAPFGTSQPPTAGKVRPAGPSVAATSTSLKAKIDKLLGLYYAGKISDDTFATEVWEEATTEERRTLIDDLWLPAA